MLTWIKKLLPIHPVARTIGSEVTRDASGVVTIDVRGQTCPGYLLSINRAVDQLLVGARIKLLITYAPCGDDVGAWASKRGIKYLGIERAGGIYVIYLEK